jgi:hypothetical protein
MAIYNHQKEMLQMNADQEISSNTPKGYIESYPARNLLRISYYRMINSDGVGSRRMSPKKRQEWFRRTFGVK